MFKNIKADKNYKKYNKLTKIIFFKYNHKSDKTY